MKRAMLAICTLALMLAAGLSTMQAGEKDKGKGKGKVYTVGKDGLKIDGKVAENSPKVKFEPFAGKEAELPAIHYQVKLSGGKKYKVTMDSDDIDSVLVVKNAAGKQVAWDDDSGGKLNSLLELKVAKDETYNVYAASLKGDGPFTLRIVELPAEKERDRK